MNVKSVIDERLAERMAGLPRQAQDALEALAHLHELGVDQEKGVISIARAEVLHAEWQLKQARRM